MSQQAAPPTSDRADGRHDFDFLFGKWRIANRKLEDPLAEEPTRRLEFEATSETRPIRRTRKPGYVRGTLFDPESALWSIWWASTIGRGQLDPPVVGRFQGGTGRFEGDDVLGGRQVKVRFDWKDIRASSARWEQSFSLDNGGSFGTNWIMELTRVA
jgi:hypothetical protein